MNRRKVFASLNALIIAVATVIAGLGGSVYAQQNKGYSGGNALKVSPVRSDVTIKPGATQTVEVFIQNLTSTVAHLHPMVNDFTVNKGNETGQPDIILDESKTASSHSLKQFVGPLDDFSLQPNEQKSIKVMVSVPASAAGGGYYGAVRFAPTSATTDRNVTLAASVGSLILVKVPGEVKEQLNLASMDIRRGENASNSSMFFVGGNDIRSVVRFENNGNIQLEPFGKVVLKNQSGKVVGNYEINSTQPRGNVLPESIRRFEIPLDKVGSFGKFTAEGNFGYGSSGQLLSAKKTFYVISLPLLILLAVLIVAILLGFFVLPRMIRSYNKSIIRKANKRK